MRLTFARLSVCLFFMFSYEYQATNETELSFKEGDTLDIKLKDDSGWWFAALGGKCGYVPATYFE